MSKKRTAPIIPLEPIKPALFSQLPALLSSILSSMGKEQPKAAALLRDLGIDTPETAYNFLSSQGRLPAGMDFEKFASVYPELMR